MSWKRKVQAVTEQKKEPQCACVHPDRYMCMAWRTDRSYDEVTEVDDWCQCYCHDGEDGEEEDNESQ